MKTLSEALREQYHEKIYRIALSSGCTCPNRDGTIGTGGCTFCSQGGSGDFAAAPAPDADQIMEAVAVIRAKTDAKHFIAYFQAYSNTYGDLERLHRLYRETVQREEIAILSLATRPDCIDDDVIDMLRDLKKIKPVWVELGLQTIHEKTAAQFQRGYALPVFEQAYGRLKREGIPVIVHVIFSLPGETREMMLDTVRYLAKLEPVLDGIKIQMLHILKGTQMGRDFEKDPFPLLSMEEYTDLVAESIQLLPEETVIHRMTGDGPRRLLIAPEWTLHKKIVLNMINRKLRESKATERRKQV